MVDIVNHATRLKVEKAMTRTMIGILLLFSAAEAHAQGPTPAQREACMPDYQKFCSSVLPGGGRILNCLREHSSEITDRCRAAISTATPPR
jgi:hypothetical protein